MSFNLFLFLGIICPYLSNNVLANITLGADILTTTYGSPIEITDMSTLNCDLIHNAHFMESVHRLVRERIPPRVVHALGAGAFGYFEVTHDISNYCKAKVFEGIGRRTPVAVRFSLAGTDKGISDITRGPKGFAIKFYTEEGNYDLLALSVPVSVVKDPLLFLAMIHATGRHPISNLPDVNTFWDFVTLRPESIYSFLMAFGDAGVPDGFRRMPGFGVHTFQVVNQTGGIYFFRYHLRPDLGIRNLLPNEETIAAADPNYATNDLYANIANGNYPSWTLSVQILSLAEARNDISNVFDVTRDLSTERYPLHQVGRLVLNRNPTNYFAEIEQLAYSPGNLVPGMIGAPDKLYEARCLAYRDGAFYRLGANFNNIQVNSPIRVPTNYLRDGSPPVNDNGGNAVNYYPNTFNGPVPYWDQNRVKLIKITESDSFSFDQVRDLYINRMTEGERIRVVDNILVTLSRTIPTIQDKAINLFNRVHPDLANRVSQRLQVNRC